MPDAGEDRSAEMRDAARAIFQRAIQEASVEKAFQRGVSCEKGILRVCEDLYDLNSFSRIFVVSIGKAAHSMLGAFVAQAGERFEGIVAASTHPSAQIRGFRYFQGGHPQPNAESMHAAEAILKSLHAQTSASLVIYLISGGGSSMVEKPIDDEISLEELIQSYRALVLSGAPIAEINAIRKHLSAVKGGRLAQTAYPAHQVSLLISDVPDKKPDALASGPTMPDSTTVQDCFSITEKHGLLQQFPDSVRELFDRNALDETPKSDDPAFVHSRWWTLASNASLLETAKREAERRGFAVHIDNTCDDWDYVPAAAHLLCRIRELRKKSERVCLLSGGELTVKVTFGGTGGRNQQFALECATKIVGENITVLSAGSDGIDGTSEADGAVGDGTTLLRGQAKNLDAAEHLRGFNATPFFAALGDTIVTGPTGNNLRDLRILLAY